MCPEKKKYKYLVMLELKIRKSWPICKYVFNESKMEKKQADE